jgi:hypothetical protein
MDRAAVMSSRSSIPPVFVLGFQRSGTTLLRLLLDAHSELAIPFESMSVIDFYHRRRDYADLSTTEQRARLVADLLAARGFSAWRPAVTVADLDLDQCTSYPAVIDQVFTAYARKCGKQRWGDKTPGYTRDVHILNELFPDAKYVHLVRDGRDAALSLLRQPWGPSDFLSALEEWNEVVGWSRKMCRMLPRDRYLEIRYEDLVNDTEGVLRQITSFLSLPFEPDMLNGNGAATGKLPERSVAFHTNLDRPVDSSLAFDWRRRLSPADQAIALKIAGRLLGELGYPVEVPDVSSLRVQGRNAWHRAAAASRWRIRQLRKRTLSWRLKNPA